MLKRDNTVLEEELIWLEISGSKESDNRGYIEVNCTTAKFPCVNKLLWHHYGHLIHVIYLQITSECKVQFYHMDEKIVLTQYKYDFFSYFYPQKYIYDFFSCCYELSMKWVNTMTLN